MQATVIYLFLIALETVIEAGVITNSADSRISLDLTEPSKVKIANENHKSLFPKNYMKTEDADTYETVHSKKLSAPEKIIYLSKSIPSIKNKAIIKKAQHFTVVPLEISETDYNDTEIPNVDVALTSDGTIVEDFLNKNISLEEQVEQHAVEISINEDKTDDVFENLSLSDQEDRNLNETKIDLNPLLKDFLEAYIIIPTKCDIHSDASDEKNDFKEFIFLDEFNDADEEISNDYEMTTEFFVDESRFKRSINVIEEENLGTTVSGFKATGEGDRLGNDLFFKNINS